MTNPALPCLLVFGQSGQLARALARQARKCGIKIMFAGRDRCDLSQPGQAAFLIRALQPSHVINAAAYTAVDKAEREPALCAAINTRAPGDMAKACAALHSRFVHVSTDYVFDGQATAPYAEDAPPAPVNVYGRTKLEGEYAVLDAFADAAIVRTSAVFSGSGDDFPSRMWTLARSRNTLDVVDDQIIGPTPVDALARRLVALASRSEGRGVYHCAGRPFVSWRRLAETAFDLGRARGAPHAVVHAVDSSAFPTAAQRPKRTPLGGDRLETLIGIPPPDWRRGLGQALDVWLANR